MPISQLLLLSTIIDKALKIIELFKWIIWLYIIKSSLL